MRQPASQWVNCLAIGFGGLALLLPQINPYFTYTFPHFLVLGGILAFLWPERGWRGGLWLAVPGLILGITNVAVGPDLSELSDAAIVVVEAVIAGGVTGWLGSRYSPRRLHFGGLR